MKRRLLLLFLSLAAGGAGRSADERDAAWDFQRAVDDFRNRPADNKRGPKLDPKRIINESNSFLKEREPEMTGEEYALYEKVVTMMTTKPEFAVKLLEAMSNDKEPASPAFDFILGNAYYSAGENEKAEAKYRSAVTRFPTFLRAWNNLGIFYYTIGKFDEAVPCFSKSIVLGDHDPATFGLLGYSLEKQGNLISAEVSYMQALAGDPANSDWKEGLLRIAMDGKQFGRAEALVKILIKERPQEPRLWLAYANILLSESRKVDAMVVLEAAAGTGVAGVDELNLLGDLYAEQNLVPEAIAIYRKVMVPAPEAGEGKFLHFVQVLIAGGRLEEAEGALASLHQELTPGGRIHLLQAKADLLAAQKRWPAARRELEALLKLAPLNGRALLSLGRAYAAEEDLARASISFEAASQITGSTYFASIELANIELKNRHYAKCVEYLQKALSIERSDVVADHLARVKSLVVQDEPSSR